MTTIQKTTVGAALAVALGAGMFEAHQNSKLNKQIQTLKQQQRSLTERISKLEGNPNKTKQQFDALPSVGLEDELDRACAETSSGNREAALDHISKSILPSDIPRALAYLATRPGMNGVENPLFSELASKWGESESDAAVA